MLARQSTDVSGEAGFRHGSLDLNKPVLRRPLSRSRCIDTSSRADDQVSWIHGSGYRWSEKPDWGSLVLGCRAAAAV
jgi:hypothetical protein